MIKYQDGRRVAEPAVARRGILARETLLIAVATGVLVIAIAFALFRRMALV